MAWRFLRWLYGARPPGSEPLSWIILQIILLLCAAWGVALVIGGSRGWWGEQYYDAEGVQTDSGVVIAKWQETHEGDASSTVTVTFLRYRFVDQSGCVHEHVKKSQHDRSEKLSIGSRLPTIEYLASSPGTHRYASEKGFGRKAFWFGLGLLAAIIPIRLVYCAVMWLVRFWERLTVSQVAATPPTPFPADGG